MHSRRGPSMFSVNTAGRQLTASCWECLWVHRHKIVHSASRLLWNPISWPSAKLFILPPVYSARSAARQRLESTRSQGISPQVTHWRLGKSGFTSVGEVDCRKNHNVCEERCFFSCWYFSTGSIVLAQNRKLTANCHVTSALTSLHVLQTINSNLLHPCMQYLNIKQSVKRVFFIYGEHVVSAVYCWINPRVNLLSAPQKNDRRRRSGVSKLLFRSYQGFIWGERHQERVSQRL